MTPASPREFDVLTDGSRTLPPDAHRRGARDRAERAVALRRRCRSTIPSGRRGGREDAPVVEPLTRLLPRRTREHEYSGSGEKDRLRPWQPALPAAARTEVEGTSEDA